MEIIEKIRKEIERRIDFYLGNAQSCVGTNRIDGLDEILAFLDFLQAEEICKESLHIPETCKENHDSLISLEDEVKNYFQGYWPGTETVEQCNTDLHFTPPAIIRLARHFAEWGAKHLRDSTKMIDRSLEEAADGKVNQDGILELSNGEAIDICPSLDKCALGLRPGDKVRIVVLKEEE